MTSRSILVVDDDPACARYLSLALRGEGYDVRLAANGVEAILALESARPDLVISDLQMPVMGGLELLDHARLRWPDVPFIVVTVDHDVATVVEAMKLGAINYLLKPATAASIVNAAQKAMAAPRVAAPRDEGVPEILGVSRAMVEVRHLIALASLSDVNVLITGATGTGKELAARAIHRCSRAGAGPWIAHNCAATPPDLFESQFFGHRRGSFTGADQDSAGLFESADGGVLFLDELESLHAAHQAKLLRVVDDGEYRPVGSTLTRRARVRLVAATNRDPAEMMAGGLLRDDLYYRLRGFEIRLPLLKDRAGDIPLLGDHFVEGLAAGFTGDAREALVRHAWPGNVRQLKNVVRAASALSGGGAIGPHHLIFDARARTGTTDPAGTLRDVEREAVLRALQDCRGNRSSAARALGIDRSTLRRKLSEYRIRDIPQS